MNKNRTTVNYSEIKKFTSLAEKWWDVVGEYKILHQINPVRISYIKQAVALHFGKSLSGLKVLDIGCGGGLLSVPMCRLGANVTGIDAGHENIEIAKKYSVARDLNINYLNTTVEELANDQEQLKSYDVVLCMEIIEHVSDIPLFLDSATNLLSDGGIIIISTINRTFSSFVKAIVFAEYILNFVPKGTHSWKSFCRPSEIVNILESKRIFLEDLSGMEYNFISNTWNITKNIDTNYFLSARKL